MTASILIVDDEPRITLALMTRLEAEGYQVFHAINGFAGIEAAAMHEPDAIVLDIRMPDIDGYEVCQRIKRMPRLKDVPVIFLSANVQDGTRAKATRAGGSAFVSKPYEAADILKEIKDQLHARAA